MRQLIVFADTLITWDAQGLTLYKIPADGSAPRAARHIAQPTAPNPFNPDPAGERMSGVCGGRIACALTPPISAGHWTQQRSQVTVYDVTGLADAADAVDSPRALATYTVSRLDDRSLALSPDGAQVASIHYGAGVVVFDALTGAEAWAHKGSIGSGVSWSPDGRWVAAGDTDQGGGALYLLDTRAAGGVARVQLPKPSSRAPLYDSPFESAWSPDGALVAFSCAAWGQRGVAVYDPASAQEVWSDRFDMASGGGLDDEDSDEEPEEEEHWIALRVGFAAQGAVQGAVLLVGVEAQRLRAYRAATGERLGDLRCPGAQGVHFAPDDARRCVWFAGAEGEPTAAPYPAGW